MLLKVCRTRVLLQRFSFFMRLGIFLGSTLSSVSYGQNAARSANEAPTPNKASTYTIGAIGDSLSTGFNAHLPLNNRALTWTTGSSTQEVNSHFARLTVLFPQAFVKAYNFAFPGVTSEALPEQTQKLIKVQPDYATVTIGANDLCKTPRQSPFLVDHFQLRIEQSLSMMISALPHIKILIAPIPDVVYLKELIAGKFKRCNIQHDLLATSCPVVLKSSNAKEDIEDFKSKWLLANQTLQSIAQKFSANVKIPPIATAFTKFSENDISKIDCFHPSISGLNLMADLGWNNGWFK